MTERPSITIPFADIESAFVGRLEKIAPGITTAPHVIGYAVTEAGILVEVAPFAFPNPSRESDGHSRKDA